MSSEASVAIEGSKQLLATAKKWDESASKTLEAAKKEKASSQKAVEKAKEHLKEMEKKYEVVNLLDESQVIDVDSTDDDKDSCESNNEIEDLRKEIKNKAWNKDDEIKSLRIEKVSLESEVFYCRQEIETLQRNYDELEKDYQELLRLSHSCSKPE